MIVELSGEFPVKLLCETMGIQRSSFYSWKKHLSDPSGRTKAFVSNILLFQEYHLKYPSHGSYRVFPNLLLSEMQIDGPLQCIVSDMTAFYVKGVYYELTLYMDLWTCM